MSDNRIDKSDMEVEINILRELIEFLEYLGDVQLPLTLEDSRRDLLVRSKETLSAIIARSTFSEPYLNMTAGRSKNLLLMRNSTSLQEYIGMEESQEQTHYQDYYEPFEKESKHSKRNNDQEQTFMQIYKNLSATQTKSKCHKCGPLYRKEGKKLFLSENRACWVALIGSHLLIYRNERHNRPYAIYSIDGYMVRSAPNLIPRDRQKSESAFEMYCPGNETLQFIARTTKDMEQWMAKICEVGKCGRNNESPINSLKEQSHDHVIKSIIPDKSVNNAIQSINNINENKQKDTSENPPPLPSRIPRRLPSLPLPSDNSTLSYEATADDDYDEEDDIYHKIEDLKTLETRYQNMVLSKKQQDDNNMKKQREKTIETYDDISEKRKEEDRLQGKKFEIMPFIEETYDDIVTLPAINAMEKTEQHDRNNDHPIINNREERETSYDDVDNFISNEKFAKIRDQPNKCVHKKSFLDRVWNRKDSFGKLNMKDKISLTHQATGKIVTSNDDISDFMPNQELEESPEYKCPPAPKPVCMKLPIANKNEKFYYDDVSMHREQRNENDQPVIIQNLQDITISNPREEEIEHYKSPRSIHDVSESQQNDELYDDIALWVDFRTRSRGEKKDKENGISTERKTWNRFNRKLRLADSNCSTTTNASTSTTITATSTIITTAITTQDNRRNNNQETEDTLENHGSVKRNTLQRLINRMENSLARVSATKGPSSLSINKSNATIGNNL